MQSFIYSFSNNLKKNPKTLQVIYKNENYSEDKVIEQINLFASYFKSKGISQDTRVVIISQNRPYFIFALYALLSLGAIPLLFERTQQTSDLFELTKDEPFVLTDRPEDYPNTDVYYFDEILSLIIDIPVTHDIRNQKDLSNLSPDRTTIILHSSGTTGLPKKVHYSEQNISWAMIEYAKLYEIEKHKSMAYILPVNCCLGIIACGLLPMLYKKEIVFLDPQDIEEALDSIEKFRINIFPAIPQMYRYMVRFDLNKYDLSSLKVCDSGGEMLPIQIIKRFEQGSEVTITEGYGQTETSSLTHFLVPDSLGKLRIGSIGKPCSYVECKIIDQNGKEVPTGNIGELLIKGPMVMKGYDDPVLDSHAYTNDKWFITGDLVYKDQDEYYYIVSRKKDLNNADPNIALFVREIEEELYELPDIVEATTITDSKGKVQIFIKPDQINLDFIEQLKKSVQEKLSHIPVDIIDIKFASFIPRTATGKVQKRLINN